MGYSSLLQVSWPCLRTLEIYVVSLLQEFIMNSSWHFHPTSTPITKSTSRITGSARSDGLSYRAECITAWTSFRVLSYSRFMTCSLSGYLVSEFGPRHASRTHGQTWSRKMPEYIQAGRFCQGSAREGEWREC